MCTIFGLLIVVYVDHSPRRSIGTDWRVSCFFHFFCMFVLTLECYHLIKYFTWCREEQIFQHFERSMTYFVKWHKGLIWSLYMTYRWNFYGWEGLGLIFTFFIVTPYIIDNYFEYFLLPLMWYIGKIFLIFCYPLV